MASVARLAARERPRQRSSTRNVLQGIITAIVHGPVEAEVGLLVNDRIVIDALVSNASIEGLELRPGGRAIALVKASLVTLLDVRPGLMLSERNLIGGTVAEIVEGPVLSEVVLDIGGGCEIAAIITTRSARDMALAVDVQALACIKASSIILAVEE
ncbi:MAG: TOBE domain-containing protein [Novosphingobium sp.]